MERDTSCPRPIYQLLGKSENRKIGCSGGKSNGTILSIGHFPQKKKKKKKNTLEVIFSRFEWSF